VVAGVSSAQLDQVSGRRNYCPRGIGYSIPELPSLHKNEIHRHFSFLIIYGKEPARGKADRTKNPPVHSEFIHDPKASAVRVDSGRDCDSRIRGAVQGVFRAIPVLNKPERSLDLRQISNSMKITCTP